MYGKLVIKQFVSVAADQHGREHGKWVTLFSRYGVTEEQAEQQVAEFLKLNPALVADYMTDAYNRERLHIQAVWHPDPVYIA